MKLTNGDLHDTAEVLIRATETHRAADVLRAAQLADKWLASRGERVPSPNLCFIMGYMAGVKDRT